MEMKNLINQLKENFHENEKILKELVIKRLEYQCKNYFYIEEVKEWSQYFQIKMSDMLLFILGIEQEEFIKILNKKVTRIKSIRYCEIKDKFLQKKRNEYMKKINLNRRTYFNKEKILREAELLKINENDFVLYILGKKRQSMQRVMKDVQGKKRLYIGRYVNYSLPMSYYKNNLDKINAIIKKATIRACFKLCVKYNKYNWEDMIQDVSLYLMENGNELNKYNKPVIKQEEIKFKKKHEILFYTKSFYYQMNNLKSYSIKQVEYNDKVGTRNQLSQQIDIYEDQESILEQWFSNKKEKQIFKKILKYQDNPNKLKIVADEENLSVKELENLLNQKRKLLI